MPLIRDSPFAVKVIAGRAAAIPGFQNLKV